jgi:hypothetical protein
VGSAQSIIYAESRSSWNVAAVISISLKIEIETFERGICKELLAGIVSVSGLKVRIHAFDKFQLVNLDVHGAPPLCRLSETRADYFCALRVPASRTGSSRIRATIVSNYVQGDPPDYRHAGYETGD